MEVSFALVASVAKTLPIGYYAKRRVNVEISRDASCSFYDPISDNITISYPQIAKGLENTKQTTESAIRAMVYHEVSHAILTPRDMEITPIINVFEDERIETTLANYYMDVDFKQNVREINNWDGTTNADTNDPWSVFYHAIRFRDTTPEINKKIEETIEWVNQNHGGEWYIRLSAQHLWNIITNNAPMPKKEKEIKEGRGKINGENTGIKSDKELTANKRAGTKINPFDFSPNDIKRDDTFTQNVSVLFENFSKKCGGGSAVQTYSGIFNPRNVVREDYRYFERVARNVGNNKFGAVHINLFLDCSGSFKSNERETNQVLKALAEMEEQYKFFDFTVIACAVGQKVLPHNNRAIKCDGGTCLTEDILQTFEKVQKQNCMNYNIVMYDGDASPQNTYKGNAFVAFNKPNCFIISEQENRKFIEKAITSARVVFSENYVNELKTNVLKALQLALS